MSPFSLSRIDITFTNIFLDKHQETMDSLAKGLNGQILNQKFDNTFRLKAIYRCVL